MAKRKKRKDDDFQKVRLKVGRKLKRDSNETKAQFNSRKIVLKEIRSHSSDPLTALAHHSEKISQHGKLTLLNHFNSYLTASLVKTLNKPIIDSLSKFIIDYSDQVRSATFKCLKTCLNHMRQQHLSIKDFVYILKPYLDCAYTHISKPIAHDSQRFLEYLTNINEPQVFEPLMHIVLRRYELGNLSSAERKLAMQLKHLYMKNRHRKSLEEISKCDRLEPLHWTETNYLLDLDFILHDLGSTRRATTSDERDVLLVSRTKEAENIAEDFLAKVVEVEGASSCNPSH